MAAKKIAHNDLVTDDIDAATSIFRDAGQRSRLYRGDCFDLLAKIPNDSVDLTISSPPYCMGKEYEDGNDIETFIDAHEKIFPEIVRITKPGGSICWQVGFHVQDGVVAPLDFLVHQILAKYNDIYLRNRIVWTFGHGFHCTNRFSGRYEVVMWYTKGKDYLFNLDAVRVRQKYPGKRAVKGPKKGQLSGNPKGKNPSDIWEDLVDDVWSIPNVKAKHVEKTMHPCQFPVALAIRLIRALSPVGGLVIDPFSGVASSGVAAIVEGRRFLGAELNSDYAMVAAGRLNEALNGEARYRPLEKEIYIPKPHEKVAIKPEHFWLDGVV